MIKLTLFSIPLCLCFQFSEAQLQKQKKSSLKADKMLRVGIKPNSDTSLLNTQNNIPLVYLEDDELDNNDPSLHVASLLNASRDPFVTSSSFNFSIARFRMRGYHSDQFLTCINGLPLENPDNGATPYSLWGGLNTLFYNREISLGLRANTFSFGKIGSTVNIDARPIKQRKQNVLTYAAANRTYQHLCSFTYNSGLTKSGWAYSLSASRRWSDEGYVSGTYFNAYSYFVGIDKKLGNSNTLSLIAFGAPVESGRQAAATKETMLLSGSNYYNPLWGYQTGKKRNAGILRSNQPVLILTHDLRFNKTSTLTTAFSYSFGQRGISGLDWYNAADPRPDYYRNLPSYYNTDPLLAQMVEEKWKRDETVRQVKWDDLYQTNQSSFETINGIRGKRSRYVLQEGIASVQQFSFNTTYHSQPAENIDFTGGLAYQSSKTNYFRQLIDLLAGDFFVDINQFAERTFINNSTANQNDLNRPNRLVYTGDKYGYDYDISINKLSGWMQGNFKFNRIDFFLATQFSNTQFWRTGYVKNGLFPNNSFGNSQVNNFINYALKAGFTFKLNGRNYFYFNEAFLTKAPYFTDVYLSPRTRDLQQDNVRSENIQSLEAGYILNAPKLRVRFTGYYTEFDHQLNVMSFYHDTYQSMVNYAISNINKVHSGIELGIEAKVAPSLTVTAAAAIARYYYNSRQYAVTTLDNTSAIVSADSVYAMNYRLGGTPHEAYSAGITYRSPKYWFISITGNYFDQVWMDINPIRRTDNAVKDVPYNSLERINIIRQEQLPSHYTVDLFAGYSWKLPKKWGFKKNTFLVWNMGVNNLLNNRDIISGGYEQLRFDFATHNANKFPSKYYYAYGLTYYSSISFRF